MKQRLGHGMSTPIIILKKMTQFNVITCVDVGHDTYSTPRYA